MVTVYCWVSQSVVLGSWLSVVRCSLLFVSVGCLSLFLLSVPSSAYVSLSSVPVVLWLWLLLLKHSELVMVYIRTLRKMYDYLKKGFYVRKES